MLSFVTATPSTKRGHFSFGQRGHYCFGLTVTQVNELLVRMERFQGVFVCCTNLMESLDQASLRRFTAKVKFGYLKPEQSVQLFLQEFGEYINAPNGVACVKTRLAALTNLTPGDYANVKRQVSLWNAENRVERIISALEDECRAKPGMPMRIGFV